MGKIGEWVNNQFYRKSSFMAWIGGLFVFVYLLITTYQLIQINLFFSKGKIESEIYERINNSYFLALKDIVMIIVLFFFRSGKEDPKPNETITTK